MRNRLTTNSRVLYDSQVTRTSNHSRAGLPLEPGRGAILHGSVDLRADHSRLPHSADCTIHDRDLARRHEQRRRNREQTNQGGKQRSVSHPHCVRTAAGWAGETGMGRSRVASASPFLISSDIVLAVSLDEPVFHQPCWMVAGMRRGRTSTRMIRITQLSSGSLPGHIPPKTVTPPWAS
jgi:hypothetical protein